MKQEFGYFLKNAKFRAALGLTLLLSYGYAIATTRVSIDSLEGDRYIGTAASCCPPTVRHEPLGRGAGLRQGRAELCLWH